MKLDNLGLEQIQDLEYQLYKLLVRAKRDKDIKASGVTKIANYLDELFETNKFSLCINYEFTYFSDIEEVIKVLDYFYKVMVIGVRTKRLVSKKENLVYC